MNADTTASYTYRAYRLYQLDIRALEGSIKADDYQLANWIRVSGPDTVRAVSYDAAPGVKRYEPEPSVLQEISRLTKILKIKRDNLKAIQERFEELKRNIRKTSELLQDLELKIFVMAWMNGMTNDEIATTLCYAPKTIRNIKSTIYHKMRDKGIAPRDKDRIAPQAPTC